MRARLRRDLDTGIQDHLVSLITSGIDGCMDAIVRVHREGIVCVCSFVQQPHDRAFSRSLRSDRRKLFSAGLSAGADRGNSHFLRFVARSKSRAHRAGFVNT